MLTIPNGLSALRIVLAPVSLALAYTGEHRAFLGVLIAMLVSDVLDGKLARLLQQTSDFGAKLDSWGDLTTYTTVPVCAVLLRPGVVAGEAPFFWLVVGSYVVPVAIGFLKFRALTSYHTRGAVVSAYLVGGATIVIFADGPTWPFRVAACILAVFEVEEIAITAVLDRPATNVRSFRHARALRALASMTPTGAPPD